MKTYLYINAILIAVAFVFLLGAVISHAQQVTVLENLYAYTVCGAGYCVDVDTYNEQGGCVYAGKLKACEAYSIIDNNYVE